MNQPIKFGTDGWRALIAEDFTFANVQALAVSVVRYLDHHEQDERLRSRGLVVGFDTRFGSDRFAETVARVAGAAGVHCWLADRFAPTPALTLAVVQKHAGAGVVITSSHNAAPWNGFKVKGDYGGSATEPIIAALEAALPEILAAPSAELPPLADLVAAGTVERFDPVPAYLGRLRELVDVSRIRSAGLRIAVDSMYGAGQALLARLLEGGTTTVTEIHAEHNPLFPGIGAPEPIPRNLTAFHHLLKQAAQGGQAFDVGISTDGDADRLGVSDEHGDFVTQLQVYGLLAAYLLETRGERRAIVRALTTTRMIDKLCRQYGVPYEVTKVGFKYVGEAMQRLDAMLGGEESGGYAYSGHIPERDGLMAALFFLDYIARTGKTPSQLVADLYAKVGEHHYDRIDVELASLAHKDVIQKSIEAARPREIGGYQVTNDGSVPETLDGYLWNLEGDGWLLIRFSGTEPLMRIYTEIPEKHRVAAVLASGRRLAGLP